MKWSNSFIQTQREDPQEAEAASHRLMLRAGLIRQLASGTYSYLPLGLRALRKVEAIIRQEMEREEAREVLLPALQPSELWQASGRFETLGQDMISFKDRHGKTNVLGPTHEEVITSLVKGEVKSYRQLPLILYQIQTKFRDEARPRFGVIRSREFIMKDAYSFDRDEKGLSASYEKMLSAYKRIFDRCGVSILMVEADPGVMGGSRSHEFLVPTESGEEVVEIEGKKVRGLEVGHIFQLGTKYTVSLEATYLDDHGERRPILMGCYGIGVNRLLAAVIEEHHDGNGIVWPEAVAPFQLLILPLLSEERCFEAAEKLYQEAAQKGWETLWDDREERPGVKFKDADLIGIPYQLIIGKSFLNEGKIELKRRRDGKSFLVSPEELFQKLEALRGDRTSSANPSSFLETLREEMMEILDRRQAELIEMTYRREGPQNVLRILVDTPGGIHLNECAELNEEISALLDEKKLIEESFLLEVASPGLDRPLVEARDFERVSGKPVRLILKKPFLNRTEFQGIVEEVKDGKLMVRLETEVIELPLELLIRGERIIEF